MGGRSGRGIRSPIGYASGYQNSYSDAEITDFLLLLRRGKAIFMWPCRPPELPEGNCHRNRQCNPRQFPCGRSRLGSPRSVARPSALPARRCDPRQSPSRRPAFWLPSAECPHSTCDPSAAGGLCAAAAARLLAGARGARRPRDETRDCDRALDEAGRAVATVCHTRVDASDADGGRANEHAASVAHGGWLDSAPNWRPPACRSRTRATRCSPGRPCPIL